METNKIFEKLKELQEILVQKYELEAKVQEAPKQLSSQEELLSRLKKEYIEKNTEYETTKETVTSLKFDLDDAIRARENGEKGMDNITTHREYEALEKQIQEATNKENEIRKELQKEEKKLEDLNETLKSDEDMINSQEQDLNASKESLNKELQKINKEFESLKQKEDKITPDLDQEILFKFERIIQRNSEGIVAVRGGVCTGCHMILPAQFANIVREGDNILFCPYCSRILYHEDVQEEESELYYNLEEAGSLADLDDDFSDEEENEEDIERDEEYEDSDSEFDTEDEDDLDDEDSDDDDLVDDDDELDLSDEDDESDVDDEEE